MYIIEFKSKDSDYQMWSKNIQDVAFVWKSQII